MIRLFDRDETNFDSNGLGVLDSEIKENVVEEKMNGIYNFDFAYLSKGEHASQLEGDMIIKAPTPDGDQLFRVYKVTKNIGFLEVNCYHIFYDLAGNFIEDTNIVSQSGQAAITHFGTGLQYATRFKFVSNIVRANSARMVRLNAVQALLDSSQDNSFLSRWGGEIKRDNFTVYMNDVRGNDKGFKIRHGKNLTGYEANIDHSSVVTRIMPYGYNGLMLPEKYVDSPLRGKYAFTRIKKIEYTNIKAIDPDATSNDESAVPLEEAYKLLRQAAELEYSVNKVDIPTSNFKVTFKNLADTKEYTDFKALEKVEPWDYVTVIADNLDIKSRMISYKYDAITKAYKEVELGNYVPSFSDIGSKVDHATNLANQANDTANTAAESANGKNSNYYGLSEPSRPVDGDLWYKKNGDKTELWQYDGKSVPPGWKLVVDDATGEEVRQNVDAAQKEAEEAKKTANESVAAANDAVAKAGFANDTADQAKSDAASALQKALDAYNHGDQIKTGLTADIDAVKGQASLKANQVDVDKLGGRVTNAEAQIKLQADQIALTVSKTELTNILGDYATQTWTQSQIKSTADQINLSVSKVQSNLDNMQIGSRNYLKSSDTVVQLHGVTQTYPNGVWANQWYVMFQPIQRYTEDVWVFSTDYIPIAPTLAQPKLAVGVMNHEDTKLFTVLGDFPVIDGRLVAAIDLSKVDKRFDSIIVYSSYSGWENSKDKNAQFDHYQMERATKVSDWRPAPEDAATEVQFSQLQITVNGIQGTVANKADKSQVTQLADQITSTVSQLGTPNYVYNPGFAGSSADGWGLGEVYYMSNNDFSAKDGVTSLGINLNNVGTSGTKTFKTAVSKRMPYSGDLSQPISASVNIRTYEVTGDVRFFFTIETFADLTSGRVEYFSSTEITGAQSGWRTSSKVNAKPTKPFKYVSIAYQVAFHGVASAHAMYSKPMMNFGPTVAPYTDSSISASQITQLSNDINLRVQKGDIINQINISPESILIAGQKVHITGQTTIDNAVIKDAMIADIKADKITAGTLNAANVNVINLNANNITTGTIKGANLSMNLNTGEVTFQHGRIHSASNNIDINVDEGYLSTASNDTRVMLKEGQLQLVQPTIFDNSEDPYLEISNLVGGASLNGANIIARDYLVLANRANSNALLDAPIDVPETFAGLAVGKISSGKWKPTRIGGAERGIIMRGGTAYKIDSSFMYKSSPEIFVGTDDAGLTPSDRIYINGSYVHIISAYKRTASGGPNVIVSSDGALVRSTSASKYKTDIIRTNATDYGDKLLNLPTATWTDIAETKRYRDDPVNQMKPTRNFGMIAEDLADAGLEMLVVRGTDGELEGINYDRIGPALIPVIAKLKNKIEKLEQQLEEKPV